MNSILDRARTLWEQASAIWLQGGWAMIAIGLIGFAMFAVGTHVYLGLRSRAYGSVPESTWRGWIDSPGHRSGVIGELLDFVTNATSIQEAGQRFDQLRARETTPFERDLHVMKVCVSAAPLVGLLGTVTGMLATFHALSSGSGGDKTMSLVAQGISEALITTETGLVIALPGLFFQAQLERRFAGYRAFIAHLETVCTQVLYRRQSRDRQRAAHQEASQQIAMQLISRLRERTLVARTNVGLPSPKASIEAPLDSPDLDQRAVASVGAAATEFNGAANQALDTISRD